ncbi:MAG: SUMF1/EgtB/PvdO family nonheme iron enzyme, partial [Anaerolineae bacterium]|nr:SUMF1/EgtB/PvdO family nonheme iron enzyme [Anaerolineae bacterium]
MKIFISYRRADSTYLIGRIRDRLMTAFGEQSVFRDLDDIPAGVDFRTVLEKETNGCNIMLVVIGPQWAGIADTKGNKRLFDPGDYTRIEVETGLKRLTENRATVFPVLVMNAPMPSAQDLPESLSQLTFQNAISIRNDPDFNNDIEKLIRDIRYSRGYAEEDISIEHFEPKTIYVAEGPFWMGSPAGEGIPDYETPQHEVSLPAYRIGKYPVTNAEYEVFIHDTGRLVKPSMGWDGQRVPDGHEKHPVAGVTWYEALAYCQWLTEKTGRRYMLPNEAQWEKACRGGNNTIFPWGEEFDPKRSNHGCSTLAAVDAYPAQNEFGGFDFVGNVRQWTCTLWGEKRLTPDPKYTYPWQDDRRNDLNANRQIRRVVRGSSMKDDRSLLRCSARSGQAPEDV